MKSVETEYSGIDMHIRRTQVAFRRRIDNRAWQPTKDFSNWELPERFPNPVCTCPKLRDETEWCELECTSNIISSDNLSDVFVGDTSPSGRLTIEFGRPSKKSEAVRSSWRYRKQREAAAGGGSGGQHG